MNCKRMAQGTYRYGVNKKIERTGWIRRNYRGKGILLADSPIRKNNDMHGCLQNLTQRLCYLSVGKDGDPDKLSVGSVGNLGAAMLREAFLKEDESPIHRCLLSALFTWVWKSFDALHPLTARLQDEALARLAICRCPQFIPEISDLLLTE